MADLTPAEKNLLRPHLNKFVDLIEGRRAPQTQAQQLFLECARGLRVPVTNYEIAIVKWLVRRPDLSTVGEVEPSQTAKARRKRKPKAKIKRAFSAAEAKKQSRGRWSPEEIEAFHKKSGFYRRKVVVYQGGGVNPR